MGLHGPLAYIHMFTCFHLWLMSLHQIAGPFFFADEPRSTHTACSEEGRNSVIEHTLEWGVNPGGGTREYYLGLRVTTDGAYPRLRRFLRKLQLLVFCTFQFQIPIQFVFPFLYCTFVLQQALCQWFLYCSWSSTVQYLLHQSNMQFSSMMSFLIHTYTYIPLTCTHISFLLCATCMLTDYTFNDIYLYVLLILTHWSLWRNVFVCDVANLLELRLYNLRVVLLAGIIFSKF